MIIEQGIVVDNAVPGSVRLAIKICADLGSCSAMCNVSNACAGSLNMNPLVAHTAMQGSFEESIRQLQPLLPAGTSTMTSSGVSSRLFEMRSISN